MSEWLIDIIKEWVLGKGYLPEADLLGWTTPVNVTGQTVPDINCMYFKAGIYNDKPYYKRQDGEWFIWSNGVDRFIISTILGTVGTHSWYRWFPSMIGLYTPNAPASGGATVAFGYNYLKAGFVDRGDPADKDFADAFFTRDGAWHDLDLSAIVPAGAKSVAISFIIRAGATNLWAGLREKGNVNVWNVSWVGTQVANINNLNDLVVPLDENRHIEYYFQAGTWQAIYLTVKGWWL